MYKIKDANVDGAISSFVLEEYDGEAEELFMEADEEAEDIVNVLFHPCSITGDDIELHREDWIKDYKKTRNKGVDYE